MAKSARDLCTDNVLLVPRFTVHGVRARPPAASPGPRARRRVNHSPPCLAVYGRGCTSTQNSSRSSRCCSESDVPCPPLGQGRGSQRFPRSRCSTGTPQASRRCP
ncbi:hypothetical protein, conserved [Leishmania tarentolae]|uniref:Uncharacterized protein n=1 Tax=Leishmania tarentolae TaxID=5689 RepID=A0A640KMC2_LEITA|nr:hypothetical protein, conserved [Leishmania tarentolae]